MTVSYASTYAVVSDADLMMPAADASPLSTTLALANAHYQQHRPCPLVVVYTAESAVQRAQEFRLPLMPSSDSLGYTLRHVVELGAGVTSITIEVEQQTGGGGWSTIYGPTTTGSLTASAKNTVDTAATITAGVDEIRVTYTPAGAGQDISADSVAVIPAAGSPTTRRTSGFWPYDDGLLGASGAPINTELVNRAMRNVYATMQDRAQCLFSFAQETSSALYDLGDATQAADGQWVLIACGQAQVPMVVGAQQVQVQALASVTNSPASTADRVRVHVGDQWIALDADGTVQTPSPLSVDVPGGSSLSGKLPIEVWALRGPDTAGGEETTVHAVTVSLLPSLPGSPVIVATPDAPATVATLWAATRGVEALALRPWAMPALAFDGLSGGGLTTRRVWLPIPPAVQRGRACVVRVDQAQGTIQSATVIETTTASGIPASPAAYAVTVQTPTRGTETYHGLGDGAVTAPAYVWSSGDYTDDTPASTTNRTLPLPEALASSLEAVEIELAAGFALHIYQIRAPMDYQSI